MILTTFLQGLNVLALLGTEDFFEGKSCLWVDKNHWKPSEFNWQTNLKSCISWLGNEADIALVFADNPISHI